MSKSHAQSVDSIAGCPGGVAMCLEADSQSERPVFVIFDYKDSFHILAVSICFIVISNSLGCVFQGEASTAGSGGERFRDRTKKLFGLIRFFEETSGSELDGCMSKAFDSAGGNENNWNGGQSQSAQALGDRKADAHRHPNVHDDQIRLLIDD